MSVCPPIIDSAASVSSWPGVVRPLAPAIDAREAFRRLCHLPHCVFFDSAMRDPQLGRYSFVAADPFRVVTASPDDRSAWDRQQAELRRYRTVALPGLPPFQGGAAGVFSYELSRSLERIAGPRHDEFRFPGMMVGLYDVVVAFDHATDDAWIVSQGFPEVDPGRRQRRAEARADAIAGVLECAGVPIERQFRDPSTELLPGQLAPQFPVAGIEGLTSNLSASDYLAVVRRAIEYIYAGDVFQVNLAQRLLKRGASDPVSLYLRLRERNPAPFAAYFDAGRFQVVSASPERFLQVCGGEVETRPIKGTRKRGVDAAADQAAAAELLTSEKDRAENVMIVDLMRNDLGRVCRPASVVVSQLCALERYEFVQHLVSVVNGRLREECGPLDLLRAAFPGGSVTGAPKIRAMQIIAELEPTARGAYCGSLGYIGFDGSMDSNILIRTITAGCGWWQFPVGSGIVADSDPEREYEETWQKAEGLLRAIR